MFLVARFQAFLSQKELTRQIIDQPSAHTRDLNLDFIAGDFLRFLYYINWACGWP
jgi:hypothetical protein